MIMTKASVAPACVAAWCPALPVFWDDVCRRDPLPGLPVLSQSSLIQTHLGWPCPCSATPTEAADGGDGATTAENPCELVGRYLLANLSLAPRREDKVGL